MFFKPDFDRQQLERMKTNNREARRPQDRGDGGEAEFKRPKFDSSNERGHRQGRGGHRGRGGRVPDHVKNPEKYTKYSLKDVPEISNKSNSAAAFDFLQKLKNRNQEEEEPAADLSQKIVFKKKERKIPKSNEEQNEPTPRNSSGEKPESSHSESKKEHKANSKSKNKNKSKLLTLSHLDDEEEED